MGEILSRDSKIYKAASHPVRLEILRILRKKKLSFGELQKHLGVRKANLSQHLGILRDHNLIAAQRKGRNVYFWRSEKSYGDYGLEGGVAVPSSKLERRRGLVRVFAEVGGLVVLVMLLTSPVAVLANLERQSGNQNIFIQLNEFLPYEHLGHGHPLSAIFALAFWAALVLAILLLIKGYRKIDKDILPS